MNFLDRVRGKIKKELVRLKKRRLEIILYHFVTSEENIFTASGHNVQPDVFREQIKYLSENFKVVPLARAKEIIYGRSDDGPYASVCFDDGYLNNIKEAYPILEEFKIPATLFVCPAVIGNQDILWRDKIRYIINNNLAEKFIAFLKKSESGKYDFSTLEKKGFYAWSKKESAIKDMSIQKDLVDFFSFNNISAREIAEEHELYMGEDDVKNREYLEFGNHTWSHPLMSCLSATGQAEEIKKSHNYLKGKDLSPFTLSLPFAPYNEDTIKICQSLGYDFILDVNNDSNLVRKDKEDFLILHRKMAPTTLKAFKKII